jgi:enamine deaminase RidA (YjgF/YER057c/UK114 family)
VRAVTTSHREHVAIGIEKLSCARYATVTSMSRTPASTFVVVSRLMRPGWLIEIEAIPAIDE